MNYDRDDENKAKLAKLHELRMYFKYAALDTPPPDEMFETIYGCSASLKSDLTRNLCTRLRKYGQDGKLAAKMLEIENRKGRPFRDKKDEKLYSQLLKLLPKSELNWGFDSKQTLVVGLPGGQFQIRFEGQEAGEQVFQGRTDGGYRSGVGQFCLDVLSSAQ